MAQPKFLFIYHVPYDANPEPLSPAEMQGMLARWQAWKQKFQANILDIGDGLKSTGKVFANGVVTDGPFMESKDVVAGYSIVSGESYEHALAVAKECPITFIPGAKVEIREFKGY